MKQLTKKEIAAHLARVRDRRNRHDADARKPKPKAEKPAKGAKSSSAIAEDPGT